MCALVPIRCAAFNQYCTLSIVGPLLTIRIKCPGGQAVGGAGGSYPGKCSGGQAGGGAGDSWCGW